VVNEHADAADDRGEQEGALVPVVIKGCGADVRKRDSKFDLKCETAAAATF
jgi:hypothetical protein